LGEHTVPMSIDMPDPVTVNVSAWSTIALSSENMMEFSHPEGRLLVNASPRQLALWSLMSTICSLDQELAAPGGAYST